MQRLVDQLSPADGRQIRILMVSFDAVRDTPEALTDNWIVAHASASDVRALAAALGIRYRELADHTFNHSAVVSFADREGVVRARTSELTSIDNAFVGAVHHQIAAASQTD